MIEEAIPDSGRRLNGIGPSAKGFLLRRPKGLANWKLAGRRSWGWVH